MSVEAGKAFCTFCGAEINPARDYRKVTGFERHRSQGGTNAIRLREVHDVWGCRSCVERSAKGISPQQGGLL